jgi:hypothetical protein
VVECTGLENRRGLIAHRGFKSHLLRQTGKARCVTRSGLFALARPEFAHGHTATPRPFLRDQQARRHRHASGRGQSGPGAPAQRGTGRTALSGAPARQDDHRRPAAGPHRRGQPRTQSPVRRAPHPQAVPGAVGSQARQEAGTDQGRHGKGPGRQLEADPGQRQPRPSPAFTAPRLPRDCGPFCCSPTPARPTNCGWR